MDSVKIRCQFSQSGLWAYQAKELNLKWLESLECSTQEDRTMEDKNKGRMWYRNGEVFIKRAVYDSGY